MQREGRRYRILEALGRGGFGTVYKARLLGHAGFSKDVALKVPNAAHADDQHLRRLRDEARMLGLIRHRSIVGVEELLVLNGRWTVVMEYVEGVSLERMIARLGPLPVAVALHIVEEVAGALHAAYHTRGPHGRKLRLIHRDVKPSNILVTPSADVKVLDFGIARATFETRESVTLDEGFGSPNYMAPERLDAVDHARSDVYSLGVVLFELLVGERLGRTFANRERAAEVRDGAVKRLRSVPDGPPEVMALVADMLAYQPDARPTARQVEDRVAVLRSAVGGPRFRDWAEGVVPVLVRQGPVDDEATGSLADAVLVEQLDGDAGAPPLDADEWPTQNRPPLDEEAAAIAPFITPLPAPRRRLSAIGGPGTRGLVAVVALGLLVPLALALGLFVVPTGLPDVPARVSDPAEVTPAAPAVPVEPLPVVAPDPPVEQDEAEPPATPEAPAGPTGPPPGQVTLAGDAARVNLVAGDARHAVPGSVPPGRYTVVATFGASEPAAAGKVTVEPGSRVALHCDALFAVCEAEP